MTTPAPAHGTVIAGKYRVERELGSGGMGIVVEATHELLGQRVAIKLLPLELAASPEILARFLREARAYAKLASDHVVRIMDVGQTETGIPYLVMELLVGHDLATELIRRGPPPVPKAVDLLLQACEGIAHAHAVGLVHRDLKPANLFLAQRPNRPALLKVLDFGLSKEERGSGISLTDERTVFGTPQYMSPEQIMSSKHVDARTDQHALGVILFELLTGKVPYDADMPTQVLVLVTTCAPPSARALRPDVPEQLDAMIARALAKRPEHRFPDVAAFAEAIAPFGGPRAAEAAAAVRIALDPPSSTPAPEPARTAVATDEAITLPRGIRLPETAPVMARSGVEVSTNEPLTLPRIIHASAPLSPASSVFPFVRSRRRRRIAVAAVLGAAVAALASALILSQGGPERAPEPDRPPAPTTPTVNSTPAPASAPPPAASEPAPAQSASAAPATGGSRAGNRR